MKKIIFVIFISIFFLQSCVPDATKDNGYMVSAVERKTHGYVNAKEKQYFNEYTQSSYTVFYEPGDSVSKNSVILSAKNEEEKKAIDEYNFKLKNVQKDIFTKNSKLKDVKIKLNTQENHDELLVSEKENLEVDLQNLMSIAKEYEYYLSKLQSENRVLAKFEGQFIETDDSFALLSHDKVIYSILNEDELGGVQENKLYIIKNKMDQKIGEAVLKNITPNDSESIKGQMAYYTVKYEFKHLDEDVFIKENESVSICDDKVYFLIPNNYILEQNKELYVKLKDSILQKVEGVQKKGYFEIDHGLEDNDEIFEIDKSDLE